MKLFDNVDRTEHGPKRHNETTFGYLNESARPMVADFRELAEQWFSRFPQVEKSHLRSRFRSSIESQHQAAFFELYIHELFLRMGFRLDPHPDIPGLTFHPDFRVTAQNGSEFYLESTLSGLTSEAEVAADARVAAIYDALDRNVDSPNFFLSISIEASGRSSPSMRRAKLELERWLARLDPDEVGLRHAVDSALPTYNLSVQDWKMKFRAIPKSPQARGRESVRPLGILGGQIGWLQTDDEIRRAVREKTKKYGLDLTLVVATNFVGTHCDYRDVLNAMIGRESVLITFDDDRVVSQEESREPNGIWWGPDGAKNSHLAALLINEHLNPWSLRASPPKLFHNPWLAVGLGDLPWPIDQFCPNHGIGKLEIKRGDDIGKLLDLPAQWPTPDEPVAE